MADEAPTTHLGGAPDEAVLDYSETPRSRKRLPTTFIAPFALVETQGAQGIKRESSHLGARKRATAALARTGQKARQ